MYTTKEEINCVYMKNQNLYIVLYSNLLAVRLFSLNRQIKIIKRCLTSEDREIKYIQFTNKRNQVVLGLYSGEIQIWIQDKLENWKLSKSLIFEDDSFGIFITQDDDLIISYENEMQFCCQKTYWDYYQNIYHKCHCYNKFSQNQAGDFLICVSENNKFLLILQSQSQKDDYWEVLQELHQIKFGQVSFVSNDTFLSIPDEEEYISIFKFSKSQQLFFKTHEFPLPGHSSWEVKVMMNYITNKKLLYILKGGIFYIIKYCENDHLKIELSYYFFNQFLSGTCILNGGIFVLQNTISTNMGESFDFSTLRQMQLRQIYEIK